jgi:hypothetical protein
MSLSANPPSLAESIGKGGNAEYDIVLVDWEYAGWYPSYWEYSKAILASGRWDDDWHIWVGKGLGPYFVEYPWFSMVFLELWS